MKKTITLQAAVCLASASSTAAISCSLIKAKDEESKDKTANNIEVNENLLKIEIK
ncbi:hypothetical protein [Mesoplasma melaleucae]|uniref:Lipoprotein n=1 Tax=Mesoplasma melaleucae TaxID=81459 RepID=A0A2K8NWI3_9MOLU|nr:hypothetical protein [Mesoplasma melaleucae]ATZ18202.1 hypothetical protein EMELA_v1c06990 [Mesoplasma melaleucae]